MDTMAHHHWLAVCDVTNYAEFNILFVIAGQCLDELNPMLNSVYLLMEDDLISIKTSTELAYEKIRYWHRYKIRLERGEHIHCRVSVVRDS